MQIMQTTWSKVCSENTSDFLPTTVGQKNGYWTLTPYSVNRPFLSSYRYSIASYHFDLSFRKFHIDFEYAGNMNKQPIDPSNDPEEMIHRCLSEARKHIAKFADGSHTGGEA